MALTVLGLLMAVLALPMLMDKRTYRSTAKLQIFEAVPMSGNGRLHGYSLAFMVITQLESEEMQRRAEARVHTHCPGCQNCAVTIHASETAGGGSLTVLATGEEPTFTRLFLDELLKELIAGWRGRQAEARIQILGIHLQESIDRQEAMQARMKELLILPALVMDANEGHAGTARRNEGADELAAYCESPIIRRSLASRPRTAIKRPKSLIAELADERDEVLILERASPATRQTP